MANALTEPTARELAAEIKKYKSMHDLVTMPDGSSISAQNYFGPLMFDYSQRYADIELRRSIFSGLPELTGVDLNTRWLHIRLRHIRMMLAQVTYKSSDYSCVTLSIGGFNFAYIYVLMLDEPAIAYISLGDSMVSYDGEWRDLMTTIDGLNYAISEYSQEIDAMAASVKIPRRPKMNVYYSAKLKESVVDKIHERIFGSGLDKILTVLAWFVSTRKYIVSPAFKKFAAALKGRKLAPSRRLDELFLIIGSIFDSRPSQMSTPLESRISSVGQKLIQLTPDESSHPLNGNYQAWNEVLVTQMTLDLILNMICPGFSIHSFWIMVYDTSRYLFNSREMHSRIEQSQTIRLTPRDKRASKILTDTAICAVNEYCGRTWRASIIDVISRDSVLTHSSKLVFEYIYALYCLHARLDQFHGDFHCDNATILRAFRDDRDAENVHVAYVIDDAAYCFQNMGISGYVIDFSRSCNMSAPTWIERIIDKYQLYFGWPKPNDVAAFGANVYAALDDAAVLERLKKIASAFDIWEFTNTTLVQCDDSIAGSPLEKMLRGIRDRATEILSDVLKPAANAATTPQWAALSILTSFWPGRPVSALSDLGTFGAIYRFNNDMKYSSRSLNTLPKSISSGTIIRSDDDEPVDMYVFPSNLVRARYKMTEEYMRELTCVTDCNV